MKTQSTRSTRWLAYRVVRRFAIANVCHFYQSPIDKMPRTPTPSEYDICSCSSKRLREHASELDYAIPERDLEMLDAGAAKCFAAFQADSLAGFAWVAFGNITGEMNHDGKPETGLPIQLVDEAAFVFQVLVLPAYRGRRLYAAILSQMADQLQDNGMHTLVLTTEGSNQNALKAVQRMQFRKVGQASFFRIGPLSRATYPTLPNDIGFTIGRYVGDDTAAHSS
ncbi:GNAT family N-acetyltransferase [Rosistilla oblonga]|uniref:Ribosomal-protein-alanine N-acetyltransferase n=3 Tax=Rosistilla TaxID=2795779 RepID=A0A518IQN8_9BACT|nr:GNAT family N-acetyltransferase [Rosistilla oblonga]QDV55399.1 ribosomal-protein-alanine N-acetyltransferase [Rosistilla oblonga]QDV68088.1 ribosomal-protein-alanine N-acetyltransferase [Rosistilla carotiformis]